MRSRASIPGWQILPALLVLGCHDAPPAQTGESRLPESVKLNPSRVLLVGEEEGSRKDAGWKLFDRSASSALELREDAVVEISLRGGHRVDRLKVFGAPKSFLTVET